MEKQDLVTRFNYHAPTTRERRETHQMIRSELLDLAEWMNEQLPDGREKSLAVTKLEEAMFWANAALARTPDE